MDRKRILSTLALILVAANLFAQGTAYVSNPLVIARDNPRITIAATTATSDESPSFGATQAALTIGFGTVTGTYTTCTVQASTTYDGTKWLTLGSAATVTVTNNTTTMWRIDQPSSGTASTSTASTFGLRTRYAFACSGGYGTSIDSTTLLVTYFSGGTGGSGGGGGGAVTSADPATFLATVIGNKTTNAAVPSSTNVGVLPCVVSASDPTLTDTFQAGCSITTAGYTRSISPAMAFNATQPTYTNGASVSQYEVSPRGAILTATGADAFNVGYDAATAVFMRQVVAPRNAPSFSSVASLTPVVPSLNRPPDVVAGQMKIIKPSDDPCLKYERVDVPISQTASTKLVSGRPGMRVAICKLRVVVGASAEITSELEGTGSACGTGTIAHSGSTTAANGEAFAANGGFVDGDSTAYVTLLGIGTDYCLGQSGSNRVSGKLSYVYAPINLN